MTLPESILKTSNELTWAAAPASLPAGAEIAAIEAGGLKNAEPFTFRLRIPPNYKISPHTHPAIEHVTVISGTLYFGEGKEYSPDTAKTYPSGSVMFMPIGHAMFGFTKDEEAIIQIHGIGPWGIEYVNPADDPRKVAL
jgi:quercetin dioxygenase-like cupin family protein